MHANCSAIGCSRANVLVLVAHVNSGENSTPSLPLSNRQWAFTPFISQYPDRVQLSEHGQLGHLYILTYDYTYIGSMILLETIVFACTAMILVIACFSSSNVILIALAL